MAPKLTKQKGWTQNDLARWQARLGLTNANAARMLGMDYQNYCDHMPGGRKKALNSWLANLCVYIEKYGPL